MKNFGSYAVTNTDERELIDFIIPGVNKEAISVAVRPNKFVDEDFGYSFGHDIVVKIADVVPADEFGAFKSVPDKIKEVIPVRGDYDIAKTTWAYTDGILRIAIPKVPEFKGKSIAPDGSEAPAAVKA